MEQKKAIDVEAIQVQKYAEEHPLEDLEHQPIAQAGQAEGSFEPKVIEVEPTAPAVDSLGGHKRSDEDLVDEEISKRQKIGEEQPVTPDDSILDAGERAPKTPQFEDFPKRQMMNQVTSADLSLYEHEDDTICLHFDEEDDVDN